MSGIGRKIADMKETRPLDPAEATFWLLDQASSMNFAVMAEVQGLLSTDEIRLALDALQSGHGMLQASIEHDSSSAALNFVHRGTGNRISLREVEVQDTDRHLWIENANATVAEEMMQPFPSGQWPLMRALILRGDDHCMVALIFHHCIADGRSGLKLLEELFSMILSPGRSQSSVLPPGLHSFASNGQNRKPQPESHPSRPLSLFGKKTRQAKPWMKLVQLGPERTGILKKRSKEIGCTLHGLIGGALLVALLRTEKGLSTGRIEAAEQDESGETKIGREGDTGPEGKEGDTGSQDQNLKEMRLALASPADMRTDSTGHDLALYISLITTTVDVSLREEDFPELCRRISRHVHASLETGALDFYELLPDPSRYLKKPDPGKAYGALIQKLPQALALSNAGPVVEFPHPDDGRWKVENVTFSVHPSLSQIAFVAVTTYCGSLNLTVHLDSHRWPEGAPEAFLEELNQL